MTLEKVKKIVDDICYGVEECHDCPFGIKTCSETICAYDKVWDVVHAEVKKEEEEGLCKIVLPNRNVLTIKEEDMDTIMEEITDYRRRKER